ncbi:MAG TPA: hypothetical protein VF950_03795, partial [Planctomycetota bacterium]
MRAWLVSWILRLLRRLSDWLSRPAEAGRIEPFDSPRGAPPEHWLRRAAPPPPAHWLARVRGAVPLESIPSDAPQTPAPAGDAPQTAAPIRRRAEPALLAPRRPSSPDAPPAGKGGSSLLRPDAPR